MEPVDRSTRVDLGAALVVAVLAGVLTRHGVLLDPDSTTYLATARGFRDDPGTFFSPASGTSLSIRGLFPPLYPLALSVAGAAGDFGGARWLGVALAGLAAFLLVRIVRRSASVTTALAVAALVFASRGLLLVSFGFLMSDGLYLTLVLAALAALGPLLAGQTSAPWRWAVLAACCGSAAFATRFVGLGVVVAIALCLGLLTVLPARQRIRMAAASLAIGIVPTTAWNAVAGSSGATGSRSLGGWNLTWADLGAVTSIPHLYLPRQGIDLLGGYDGGGAKVVGGLAIIALAIWTVGRFREALRGSADAVDRTVAALLLVAWGHLGTLVLTKAVVDVMIPLGGRHVMVWTTCLTAALGIDLHRRLQGASVPRWARPLTTAVVVILLAGALPGFARTLADPVEGWSNLAQVPRSDLADEAAALPRGTLVYSNREDLIYLQTGRMTALLPERENRYDAEPNRDFEQQLEDVGDQVRSGSAAIIVFTDDPQWAIPLEELEASTGLTVVATTPEGALLRAR